MPNVFGIYNDGPKEQNIENLKKMQASLLDDPSYSTGLYTNEQIGIYVGWTAHNESFCDCMPIYSMDKKIIMFFIGENFGCDHLIDEFKSKGYKLDSDKSSYLVPMYEEMGEEFVNNLNGIFSGVVVDLRQNKILLFNDRYGLQRLYFYESKNNLLFSSKTRAITKIESKCRDLDYQSLGELFSCKAVLENRSLFANIGSMPGGSIWSCTPGGQVVKKLYFTPDQWENQETLDPEQYYQELKTLLPEVVRQYVNPKDKMAISLTGGLDTRMILASMELIPGKLPTYTHGGMFNDSFDVKIARKVARVCRQPHRVINVGNHYLTDFHEYAKNTVMITDGNLNVTESVGLYTNQIVKQSANIRLTGNYGSEILRSHVMFKPQKPNSRLYEQEFLTHLNRAKETYFKHRQVHPLTFIAFCQVPWYHYNRYCLEQSQITQRSPFLDNNLVKLVYQAPSESSRSAEIPMRFVAEMNPELGKIRTDRGVGFRDNKLRALGTRAAYEFLFKMDYYFNHGMPQWVAKSYGLWAPLKLENIFLGRHKYNHFRVWFRDQLAGYIKEILLDPRTLSRSYLNSKNMETIVNGHTSGRYNYTQDISSLLTIELLHRCLIDR